MAQSKFIKAVYEKAGVPAPKGKGMHTVPFHKIAASILKSEKKGGITKEEKQIAYATAMKKLGRDKAVNKSHQVNKDKK